MTGIEKHNPTKKSPSCFSDKLLQDRYDYIVSIYKIIEHNLRDFALAINMYNREIELLKNKKYLFSLKKRLKRDENVCEYKDIISSIEFKIQINEQMHRLIEKVFDNPEDYDIAKFISLVEHFESLK